MDQLKSSCLIYRCSLEEIQINVELDGKLI